MGSLDDAEAYYDERSVAQLIRAVARLPSLASIARWASFQASSFGM
jgi:hypothetical protein